MIRVLLRRKPDRPNYQLYYVDPVTGRTHCRSARTGDRRKAERAAQSWELELESGAAGSGVGWDSFRARFELEHVASLSSKRSGDGFATALNHFERVIGRPRDIRAITASVVSRFAATLRGEDRSPHSVANYLTHLRVALRWAASVDLLKVAPTIKIPKTGKRRFNRGRSLTAAEVQGMIEAVPQVVGEEFAAEWVRLLRGLHLGGFRIEEAVRLSWDCPPAQIAIDGVRFPRVVWFIEGHKGRRDVAIPLTPDFVEFLRETPAEQRHGRLFSLKHPRRRVTPRYAGVVVSEIGEKAEIRVNQEGRAEKFASAHDLRRTFGTRWALKVRPMTLQAMMRHRSIETTLKFYVDLQCDDVGAELWGQLAVENGPSNGPKTSSDPSAEGGERPENAVKITAWTQQEQPRSDFESGS